MPLRYLSEFYTFRDIQPGVDRLGNSADLPLEQQIQMRLLRGNRAFVTGRYADALADYRTAWRQMPRLVDPLFPPDVGECAETELLAVDLIDPLVSASVQVLRLRDGAGPDVPIVAAVDPPETLLRITGRGSQHARPGGQAHETGLAHLRAGERSVARRYVARALWQSRRHAEAQADARTLSGVLAVVNGEPKAGQDQFADAAALYQAAGNSDGLAAMRYNRGVAAAVAGNYQEAVELLSSAATAPFLGVSWQLSRSTLPGVASFSLVMDPPGLPLVVRGSDGRWIKIASGGRAPQTSRHVVHDGAAAPIDLEQGRDAELAARFLESRVAATTLTALDAHLEDLPSFTARLAHVFGLVLPLSLGDAYAALGDYDRAEPYFLKVRGYRFLNTPIEKPALWRRLAETYLERGKSFLAEGRLEEARQQFSRIAPWSSRTEAALADPLYSGAFATYHDQARAFRAAEDPVAFAPLDYSSRIVLLEAVNHLHRLAHGIDRSRLLSHPLATAAGPEQQRLADDLARQARHVASLHQSVASAAQSGEFGRDALQRLLKAQEATLTLEEQMRQDAEKRGVPCWAEARR